MGTFARIRLRAGIHGDPQALEARRDVDRRQNVPARNVVLGQIRGEAVFIFDLEEVATVIALHRKVGTNVVVDLRLKGIAEPRESDIWLLGAIGPRMVYSTNLDAARRACDRRMVTFAHTAPDCAEIMWNEQNWTLVCMPICWTRAQWDEGLRTVRQFNDLLRVLPPVPQPTRPSPQSGGATRPRAGRWRPPAVANCRRGMPKPAAGERIHDAAATRSRRVRSRATARRLSRNGHQAPNTSAEQSVGLGTGGVPRPVALITGPTSGIGAGFARRYARDGIDLVLVARNADRLDRTRRRARADNGADVEVLPADLAEAAGRAKVAERLAAGASACWSTTPGFGTSGEFWTADLAQLQAQLDVNVTAIMQLTRAALPSMMAAGSGTVDQHRQRGRVAVGSWIDLFGIEGVGGVVHRGTGRRSGRHRGRYPRRVPGIRPYRIPRAGRHRHDIDPVDHVARGRRRGPGNPRRCRRRQGRHHSRRCSTR